MTIECYLQECPHHATHADGPEEGPFCYREHCAWTTTQIESKAYLTPPPKLVEPETIQIHYMSELYGRQGDKAIVMKGMLEAANLKDAFKQAMEVWPFPEAPLAIQIGPYEADEEEGESDADVHRT